MQRLNIILIVIQKDKIGRNMRIQKLFTGAGAITGYIVGVIGVIIGIFTIDGELTIQYRWLILLGVMILFLVIFSAIVFMNANKILKEGIKYPIYGCESENNNIFLYIKYSNVFRIEALVSIYIQNNNINKKIGIGTVYNMDTMEEKYTEIQVIKIYDVYIDIFEKAQQKNKLVLDSMYVAPIVTKETIANLDSRR